MTQAKKLKKAIRARARKTGESYTVARRHILHKRAAQRPAPPAKTKAATSRGGMSDAAIRRKTGHGLDHWFAVLDAFDPKAKSHTDRARHLHTEHGVPDWYCQGVTVAWERAKGLRVTNQSCAGTFQVNVSKAVPASVRDVADAIGDAQRRALWLSSADPALRRAVDAAFSGAKPRAIDMKTPLYARLRFPWDGATVEIRITGKAKGGTTTVVADNSNLPDHALVELRRAQWKAALEALKKHLAS